MATLKRCLAVLVVALWVAVPAYAGGLEGGVNVYGWPLDPVASPLAEQVEWVASWKPGTPRRSAARGGRVTYGKGSSASWYNDLAFAPDGSRALRSTYDDISLLTIPDGDVLWRRPVENTHGLVFSPDGKRFVRVSDYGGAWLHDAANGSVLATWSDDEDEGFDRAAFSPDGRLVALALSSSAEVRIVDANSGETRRSLGGTSWITTLAFSADGKRLLAFGSSDLRVWELSSGRVLFFEKDWRWSACAVDADLTVAWLGGEKGWLERLELRQDGSRQAWTLPRQPDIYGLALTRNAERLVVAHHQPYVSVVDLAAGTETHRLEGSGDLAMSADGRRLLVAGDGSWGVWETAGMSPLREGAFHRGGINAVAQSGRLLASGDDAGTVLVRDLDSGVVLHHLFGHASDVTGLAFAPPGSPLDGHLLVGSDEGAWLYELGSGQLRQQFEFGDRGVSVAFSPGGEHLILSAWDDDCNSCGHAELWDAATLERRHVIKGVGWRTFAFARDGALLVASGYGSPVQVVDLEAGRILRWTTSGRMDEVHDVAVRDDRYIVVASDNDGYHHLWTPGMDDKLDLDTCGMLSPVPGGKLVVAGDCDDGFVVMETSSGTEVGRIRGLKVGEDDWLGVLAFSADGRQLLLGYGSGRIVTQELGSYGGRGSSNKLAGLALPTPGEANLMDLDRVQLGAGGGKLTELTEPLSHHTVYASAEALAVSADGRFVAVAPGEDGAAIVMGSEDGEPVFSAHVSWDEKAAHVWFGTSGLLAVSPSYGKRSVVHDIQSNQITQTVDDDCSRAFVRADGTVVCTGPRVRLVRDGQEVASLKKYLGSHDAAATTRPTKASKR